ncbi:MAG: hypothetical protein K6F65_02335 [Lachnospiraceae bacterium]|nr:hypothetical protein [Lachnospiraceae bacterium]
MKNENNRKLNIRLVFVHISFWGFIIGFPILYMLIGAKIDTVNFENRNLAEKPELTAENISDFPLEYEAYYNDNFPFRSKLITLNSRISYQLLGEGSGATIVGKDGWLFYNAENIGNGISIGQYKGIEKFTDEELRQAAGSLEATQKWCEEHGCEFVLFIAPNKERVYGEYMPDEYGTYRQGDTCNTDQLVDYLRQNTDIRVVWAYEDMLEYKEGHPDDPMYYHLDTHWNYLGGYIGSRALLRELGIEIPSADEKNPERVERYQTWGDLTNLMNLGASDLFNDTDYVFPGYPAPGMQIISDDVNGIVGYTAPGRDSRNVVIYRDSFCNIMRYFLGEHFNTIRMIPKEYWDPSVLEENTPDVLVIELTERFVDILVNEHIQP